MRYAPLTMLLAPPRRLKRWWRVERWQRRMRRFYAQFIKPGDLVFDIGANVGSRTRVFLELGARVVAVEPQKACARSLLAAFGSNPHFHLINKALGAADGASEIFIAKHPRTASLSPEFVRASQSRQYRPMTLWEKAHPVSVTTLDALIQQHGAPAFVKIDAEGFEYEIMRGLSQPLTLSFEFVPTYLEPALQSIEYLRRFGAMRLNYVVGERLEWMIEKWVTADELIPMLKSYAPETDFVYGDVYVRFEGEPRSPNIHSAGRTP